VSFWRDRPTLVTGATGLVGSWAVKRLYESEADVVCLVRDWVPQSELVRSHILERVKVVRGDIRDQALLERTLGEYEIDTVLHLGAQTIVPIAGRNPVSTFESNIGGTWTLLEACRRSPLVKQVVTASSDKAYGDHGGRPYDETMALQGVHPYDVSKSAADLIAQTYARIFEVPVAITRCGNFYGGGDLNWNRIVPGTIRAALRGQRPLIRSDGKPVRDYFYVQDGVAAYLLLAERLHADPGLRGEAFNFSNETPVSVREVAQRILDLMGSRLTLDVRNEARNEIAVQCLDASKARRVLNWSARFSLDEGLRETIAWYRQSLGEAAAA